MKKILTTFICLFILFCALSINAFGAQDMICNDPFTGNQSAHDYGGNWASVINSYLVDCSDNTLMRFQYNYDNSSMFAEYYSYDYEFISGKIIPEELPVFGGFYASDDFYFILTGMNNPSESAAVECFRITKYDKNWNRIASAGIYDCNTTFPFDAGSARFAQYEDNLIIRTSHEMYTSSDGLNHQSNFSIELNINTMEIIYNSYGYVSHSFNQFVKVKDNEIVTVDHGDAYPRSVVLVKHIKDSSFYYPQSFEYDVLPIFGNTGNNYTGCTVGGFEISDSAYITVGTSVIQNAEHFNDEVQNIYVSSLSASTNEVTFEFVTDYKDESPSVPYLVKLSDSEFLLIWEKDGTVFYRKLDSTGALKGEIYEMQGELSDCEPVFVHDKIIWYVYTNNTINFYTISTQNLSESAKISAFRGHQYEVLSSQGAYANLKCKKCSAEKSGNVPQSYLLWEAQLFSNGYSASSLFDYISADVGDTLIVMGSREDETPVELSDVEFSVSDPSIATIRKTKNFMDNTFYYIEFLKSGNVKLRYSSAYLPEYGCTVEVQVGHTGEVISIDKKPTCTDSGLQTILCSCCNKTFTEEIPAKGHTEVFVPGKAATCTESGLTDGLSCAVCNIVIKNQEVIPAQGHAETILYGSGATCTESGSQTIGCTRCYKTFTKEIPALGHDWTINDDIQECIRCNLQTEITVPLIITADKDFVKVGDTVTYTVSLGQVSQISGIEFQLAIPDGLTYVNGSLEEGLQTTLGAAVCGFNQDAIKVVIAGGMSYTSTEITPILKFTCKVEKEISQNTFMDVDTDNWYVENIYGELKFELVNNNSVIYTICEHSNTLVYEAVSPSCTETGFTAGEYCSVCNTTIKEQEIIPAKGHSFSDWTVIKAPTDTECGIEERVCSVCEETETREIAKTNQIIGDVNADGQITAADARIILRISAKLEKAEDYNLPLEVFDIKKDGNINAADARKALRISAKLEK